MHDESVRQLVNSCLLNHIYFLVTIFTHIIVDKFSLDKLFEAVVDTVLVLNFEGQVVEVVNPLLHIAATLAREQVTDLASEDILKKILLRCFGQLVFHLIEEHI